MRIRCGTIHIVALAALAVGAAAGLYEQLEFSGISDADAQNIIYRAAYLASFSYECLEPSLQIYDKVYKNMGVGNGIFSWCSRARRQGGK